MDPNAVSALLERSGARESLRVVSRGHGAWEPQGPHFAEEVRALAAALSGYGLRAGARGAVLGPEGSGTLRAELAVIAAGATLVPLDPVLSDEAVRRALESTGAIHAIASDERQLARVLALRPDLSALDLVLLMEAPPSERRPAALLAHAAMEVGAASLTTDPRLLRRAFAEGDGGTACLLVDSSGETRPVARAALVAFADTIARTLGLATGRSLLAALPVGGIERLGTVLAAWSSGATLLLADPGERLDAGLGQRPADSVVLDVEGLGRLYRAWNDDIGAMSWFGRGATRWALRQGRAPEPHPWRHRITEKLVLRRIRDNLGGRVVALDVFAPASAREPTPIDSFFAAVGLPVRYHSLQVDAVLAR